MGVQSTAGPDEGSPTLFSGEYSRPKTLVNRSAIAASLETDEEVIYGLPGEGELICDRAEGKETIAGEELGLVVTDMRVLLVARQQDGREVIVVPYARIDSTDVTEGFFQTRLDISLSNGEQYRLQPVTTKSLTRVTGYIDVASECVDEVDPALERAREAAERLAEHLRAGSTADANQARKRMRGAVGKAESALEEAGVDPGRSADIEETQRACAILVAEARLDRSETLVSEAIHQADATAYTGAYRTYLDARKHLETALALDIRYELAMTDCIQSQIARIDNRIEALSLRPLALAKQARERAMHTDTLEDAVEAWELTFEHYRDLLTAGWGTDLDFAGKKSDIKFQLECAVDNLIECRRSLARIRETEGEHHRQADEFDEAQACYDEALKQVDRAQVLAKQYRAGDTEAIRAQRAEIVTQRSTDPDV